MTNDHEPSRQDDRSMRTLQIVLLSVACALLLFSATVQTLIALEVLR